MRLQSRDRRNGDAFRGITEPLAASMRLQSRDRRNSHPFILFNYQRSFQHNASGVRHLSRAHWTILTLHLQPPANKPDPSRERLPMFPRRTTARDPYRVVKTGYSAISPRSEEHTSELQS